MMSSQWSKYLTTGIKVAPGDEIPIRKEIRDLSKQELYLFLEGLARFQQEPQDDPLSYYQIAGIHGRPYTTWPDKGWNNDIPLANSNDNFRGFCTHNSILFLTWHRPYLALFEAQLYGHVNAIAEGITSTPAEKERYVTTARNFRMPYWDWARRGVSIFPEEALYKKYTPSGPPSSASVHPQYNPLFHTPFKAGTPSDITLGHDATVRYPKCPKAQEALIKDFTAFHRGGDRKEKQGRNLTERVAYILLKYQKFDWMSNNAYRPGHEQERAANPDLWGSIEDIHNSVHDYTGGDGGHMTELCASAFDPIFWLHHANIDRLFAIWQALHEDDQEPDTWVSPKKSGVGNIITNSESEEDANTNLYPFRPTVDTWYTSNTVKRTEPFGYAYAETSGLHYPTTDTEKQALKEAIDEHYATLTTMIRQSQAGNPRAGAQLLPQAALLRTLATSSDLVADARSAQQVISELPAAEVLLWESLAPSKPFLRDLLRVAPYQDRCYYHEWLVNVKAERHALGGAYAVHLFLGPVQEGNMALWSASPHHVGVFAPLGQVAGTGCGRCRGEQRARLQVTGQIPLTLALVERYLAQLLPDLTPAAVVPYLTKNLHWRVAMNGEALENRSDVDGLTVFVVSNEVTVPEDPSQFPIYAPDVTVHPEITTNRGGTGRGEGTGLAVGQL